MEAAINYYPFHIGDYIAHTAHLDPIEDCAYRRLLDAYYLNEGPLPADAADVARKIRMKANAADVERVLNEFFTLTDDGWLHARCNDEISKMKEKQSKAKASAEASVRARQAKAGANVSDKKSDEEVGDERTLNERSTDAELPTPTPTPTPEKEEANASLSTSSPAKSTRGSGKRAAVLSIDGVPDSLFAEWLQVRRAKKAGPVSQTVVDALQREAGAAGITVEQAVRTCVERGWQGFNAEWLRKAPIGPATRSFDPGAPVETYAQRAARQRVEEVSPMAARKAPGAGFEAAQRFMNGGDVIDVMPRAQPQLEIDGGLYGR